MHNRFVVSSECTQSVVQLACMFPTMKRPASSMQLVPLPTEAEFKPDMGHISDYFEWKVIVAALPQADIDEVIAWHELHSNQFIYLRRYGCYVFRFSDRMQNVCRAFLK